MAGASAKNALISLSGITKVYPGAVALAGVDFDLRKGEIHALVGENGAGKSSLIKILSGDTLASAGQISVNGSAVNFTSPQDAKEAGIVTVFQELTVIPSLTVAENVVLGNLPMTGPMATVYSRKTAREIAQRIFARMGIDLNPDAKAETLSTGEMQLVEIARGLVLEPPVLILDEPTASLSDVEAEQLLGIMKQLRDAGHSMIFVSHRLDEVLEVSDRITVLRNGELIEVRDRKDVNDTNELVSMMVGGVLEKLFPQVNANIGSVHFRAEGLTREGVFEDVSFDVRSGEIVGFSGLVGAGRTEVMRSIIGADPLDSGSIVKNGVHFRARNPRHAIEAGISYLSEDRKGSGVVLSMSGYENVVMSAMPRIFPSGFIKWKQVRSVAEEISARMRFRGQLSNDTSTYSGGNQQKIAIGKLILSGADLLILDEPTRGVDVGAKAEIYQLIHEAAEDGAAVVVVSSELPELLNICHRIVTMSAGKVIKEFQREDFDENQILRAAFAGHATGNGTAA
ncbi:sugar ABC transporter ATP-binding protein (plasmid) [Leisingera sp. M527]|uniref:sugar ABC transporter ATP-binding protein n=1 Tax=Leisingera sp. M527 TaxID=2867014 RepID=UPI0021A5B7FD|nr:sugar ABC transporter ATP-binding protein [Leisingera sp. M527]UWQ35618.1 sugar ABC transporter ATP-binding protein [Leisingera sp. M527]